MSHLKELQEHLSAARAALTEALTAGADTAEHRQTVARLEGEVAAADQADRQAIAAAAREDATRADQAGAAFADESHAAIEAAVDVPGLAELAGAELPPLERDARVEAAARAVARCRAALEKAEAEHRPHSERVASLQDLVRTKLAAIEGIVSRRREGDERDTDANDLAMLRDDAGELEGLLGEAKIAAAEADTRPAARAALNSAETELQRAQKKAAHIAALERVRQVEAMFVDVWRRMVELGRAAGEGSPWSSYQATPEMRRAVTGQITAGFRGQL